jgi:hypothetical protein
MLKKICSFFKRVFVGILVTATIWFGEALLILFFGGMATIIVGTSLITCISAAPILGCIAGANYDGKSDEHDSGRI